MGGIVRPDGGGGVELDLDVEPVVAQQKLPWRRRLAEIARELPGPLQPGFPPLIEPDHQCPVADGEAARRLPARAVEWRRHVEEPPRPGDHRRPPQRIVAAPAGPALGLGNGVGAIERVVERSPAGVGGVQCVAGVHHRHHQLRPGDLGDLGIDAGRGDAELRPLRHQIADIRQEGAVGRDVARQPVRAVPVVELPLQALPRGEQGPVPRRQVAQDRREARPERLRIDAGARQCLGLDEIRENFGHLEARPCHPLHLASLAPRHQPPRNRCRRHASTAGGRELTDWRTSGIFLPIKFAP